MSREVRVIGEVSSTVLSEHAWLAELETLEDVLRRDLSILEVIVQDEYTHDVVTSHALAGHEAVHVVFDTT
jgi:hypothetical protein